MALFQRRVATFCVLSLLSWTTLADETEEVSAEPVEEHVITLTEANFDEFVGKQARTLVEFYAPWCGHCKQLAPHYEEAARILKEEKQSPTALAKVDATEAPQLSQQFKIEGYPTLVLIEGKETIKFDGGRDTNGIVDWVLKHDIPAYELLTYEEFESVRSTEVDVETDEAKEFQLFAFIKKGTKRERLFNSFANELRGEKSMSFYKIYLQKDDKYKVILRRNNKKQFFDKSLDGAFEVVYNGKFAPSKKSQKSLFTFKGYDIGTWLHEHRLPFFINLDDKESGFAKNTNTGVTHPYSVLYYAPKTPRGGIILIRIPENDDSAVGALKNELKDLARSLRANEGIYILFSSAVNERIGFTEDCKALLIEKSVQETIKLPASFRPMQGDPNRAAPGALFSQQYERSSGQKPKETLREYRYQYKGEQDVNAEVLSDFVKNALVEKSVERWLKSSDNVETAEDIYYEIVNAKMFESVVLSKESDVLVLYCTSWGQYCQGLMEEYNKLAKHVSTYYKGKAIKIMYMDCDENDVDDIRVQAFPTMILYPGGTDKMKKGKLLSQEQRTVDDIVDFLDEYAVSLNKDEL